MTRHVSSSEGNQGREGKERKEEKERKGMQQRNMLSEEPPSLNDSQSAPFQERDASKEREVWFSNTALRIGGWLLSLFFVIYFMVN